MRASASLPSSCSGAMYWKVPMITPSSVSDFSEDASVLISEGATATGVDCSTSLASPKSISLAPALVSMMLPGLRSR